MLLTLTILVIATLYKTKLNLGYNVCSISYKPYGRPEKNSCA